MTNLQINHGIPDNRYLNRYLGPNAYREKDTATLSSLFLDKSPKKALRPQAGKSNTNGKVKRGESMADQYAIIRMKKLHAGDLSGVERHNLRLGPPEPNVDPSRTHLNEYIKAGNHSLKDSIVKRVKDAGITRKIRDDAVYGIEVVMTASPEFFDDAMRQKKSAKLDDWKNDSIKYLYQLAGGEENVVQLALHMDEETPHLVAVFVPISDDAPSTAKKKKTEKKPALNAKPWTSPGKWQRMWTTYAAAMAKHGLQRGEFRLETEPPQEHVTLKQGREELIKTARQAEATAERAVAIADRAETHLHETVVKQQVALKRQDAKIDLVVKKQEQVILEQRTLIESLTTQLKTAYDEIKRLLKGSGAGGPQTPRQGTSQPQNETPTATPPLDDLGM